MNLSGYFIRRPVATTLLMAAIFFTGLFAYQALPVAHLPNVDFPTINVSASLAGASPETMAATVATPLEREFSTISGLESMTSTSSLGSTQITLQFHLDRDIDAAAQDVQSMISKAARELPRDMDSPPFYRKVNPADMPILYLALTSDTLPLSAVDEFADKYVAQRLSMLKGVAQVNVYGSQKYAVRVQMDPNAMAMRGVGIDEVATAIRNANVSLPTGSLFGEHKAYTVQASGQLLDADAFRPLIVAYRDGAPLRLGDLGQVLDSVENDKVATWRNNQRAVVLAVLRQPGSNTVEIVDSIRQLLPEFHRQMPAAMKLEPHYDRSESIRESVRDVQWTLMFAIILVILVIFLFLRNISATVIPSLALPMSIMGAFAVMYPLGFSIDNLSLMALILSVGFVVDDAIVMLENIVRHMENGESPYEAAIKGSREIWFTILAITVSLVAVFIPVLFLGGILGKLLNEFAITISVAILVSGVVSLTLTPMLCSRFLKAQPKEGHGYLFNLFDRGFKATLGWYATSLGFVLRHRLATLLSIAATLALTVYLFMLMPTGFLPNEDTSLIFAFTEAEEGISFDRMKAKQMELMEIVGADPNVHSFVSAIGSSRGGSSGNTGRMFIRLKPTSQRRMGVEGVINELRKKAESVSGIRMFMQNPPQIRIGGRLTKSTYQLMLQSPDIDELFAGTLTLTQKLQSAPGLREVTSDLQIKSPNVYVEIDRDKAASLGVTPYQVEEALGLAFGARQVSTILAPDNQYPVILELMPEYQTGPQTLGMLYVRSGSGTLVPLSVLARVSVFTGPLSITHQGQFPSVTISFNLEPGVSLGEAVRTIDTIVSDTLPPSVTTSFQGAAQAFQDSQKGLLALLIMAILIIYVVLGILYENFFHPVTILSGLPSAGLGALVALMAFGMELNLYSFVGIIMLVGLVKKNAIMMIDFALAAQREENKPPLEAITQGCLIRFRPIMMTTMCALVGTLPIALGFGAGAEARQSLGIAVVGGLMFSQLITLFITPVFYLYMDSLQGWSTGLSQVFSRGAAGSTR